MAIENYLSSGLKIERTPWWDIYTGAAAALMEAKIVAEHDLPGQPGNNRLMVSRGDRDQPGYIQVKRHPRKRSPDRYDVWIRISTEEETRRRTAKDAALRETRETENADRIRYAHAAIKESFKAATAAEFLSHLRSLINGAAWSVHDCTQGNTPRTDPLYDFRLESHVGDEVVRLLNLAHAALGDAKATRDTSVQSAVPHESFERAIHDREFQRFLENQGLRG
ncbi:MAG: hypothetical protein P4L96_12385 [Rhodoferax sp.]|nr:hypothetical protein [Rhodoferax sp.]